MLFFGADGVFLKLMNANLTCTKVGLLAYKIPLGISVATPTKAPNCSVERISIESLTVRANAITPILRGILDAHKDTHWNSHE